MQATFNTPEEQQAFIQLTDGISQLGLSVNDEQLTKLMSYLQHLLKWNQAYNLTALKTAQQMVSLHLLDSLAIIPYLSKTNAASLLDVGTGAGLPGVVLAIMFPHWRIALLDSNGKKMRFLFQVKSSLKLDNVELVNERVESYHAQAFELISSRAFASITNMVSGCQHLLTESGYFVAMKGQYPEQELNEAIEQNPSLELEQNYKIELPNEDAQRHLLMLKINP